MADNFAQFSPELESPAQGAFSITPNDSTDLSYVTRAMLIMELACPVYDDRTIGGYDTNGAPLQPTYDYVIAA